MTWFIASYTGAMRSNILRTPSAGSVPVSSPPLGYACPHRFVSAFSSPS